MIPLYKNIKIASKCFNLSLLLADRLLGSPPFKDISLIHNIQMVPYILNYVSDTNNN